MQKQFLNLLSDFISAVGEHKKALSYATVASMQLNDFCLRVMMTRMPFDSDSLLHDAKDLAALYRRAEAAEDELLIAAKAIEKFILDVNK